MYQTCIFTENDQWWCMASCRAVQDAPILFCDEATSALDSETEADIMAHMKVLSLPLTYHHKPRKNTPPIVR